MLKISDNALAIETPADTLHFGSFISRNATYQLILDLWTAQAPEASREFIAAENQTQLGQEHDTASSPAGNTPRKATQCGTDPFEAICLDIRLPTTPEKVFGLMWRDENFIKSFWKGSQQLSDIDLGPWQGEGRKKRYYSYNKPLHNPVGPKSIHCNLSDEELNTDPETYYEVLTVTKTPAAPAGDIFQVKTKTVNFLSLALHTSFPTEHVHFKAISWAGGAKGGSKLLVSTQCEWEGRHMLKVHVQYLTSSVLNSCIYQQGTISKAAVEGQRSYHKDMAKHMREYIKQHSIEFATGDVIDAENDDELEQTEKPDMLQRLRIGIMDVDDPIKLVLAILCVLLLLTTMHLHLSRPSGRSSHASPPLRSLSEDAELVGRVERLEMTLLSLKAALSDV